MKLRLVGYWKEQLEDELPFPQELERENDSSVRERVAMYLDAGTGIDVEYQPTPNARTYSLIRELYEEVAINLGRKGFAPRDFIDVQTFLWVASGMKREVHEQRERKAAEALDE